MTDRPKTTDRTFSEIGHAGTSPELLALIEHARDYKMTPHERREQKVSFVFGMLSSKSELTKDDVRRIMGEQGL